MKYDPVTKPEHYSLGMPEGVEVIDIIESQNATYFMGNVIKYVLRAKYKGSQVQDLEKAAFYLDREIKRLKSEPTILEVWEINGCSYTKLGDLDMSKFRQINEQRITAENPETIWIYEEQ